MIIQQNKACHYPELRNAAYSRDEAKAMLFDG